MPQVQLFATCLIDSLFPEVGESVIACLEAVGMQVGFPEAQTCCGQPAFNAGYRAEARQMALHTLDVFSNAPGAVIIPSGSCAAMVRHGYLELFRGDQTNLERARRLAARTYEFSEYLNDVVGLAPHASGIKRVAYHPACHTLRNLGVDRQPKTLLAAAGVQVKLLEEVCCGFGGVFAVDQAELSAEMLQRKLDGIEQTGVECVTACDVSCLMHIEGGLRRAGSAVRCAHIAQVLAGSPPGLR